MGDSRDSVDRFQELYEEGGEAARHESRRRTPILPNRVAPESEPAGGELACAQPAWGQRRVANELTPRGVSIAPAGVRCVGQRHERKNLPKRLKALAAQVAQEGKLLTAAQRTALEKGKADKEAMANLQVNSQGMAGRRLRSAAAP